MAPCIALELPRLRPDQWAIVQHPAKVKTVAMGRRWGKSVLGQCVAIPTAMNGARVAWCVPTYKNGRTLWRMIEKVLGPLKKRGLVRINRAERTVEFPNGGFLAVYSMDNPDSIRGENFHLIIVDEAAMVSEQAWTDCIQPTLADNNGDCILISTPKGRNWFWREFNNGLADMAAGREHYASWTAPTSDNPNPNIKKAAERAKTAVPDRTYQQEWLAKFLEDGGTVFRGVSKVTTGSIVPPYRGTFVMGVDWGKDNDFTCIRVIDVATGKEVDSDRFNDIGWSLQRGRLAIMFAKWKPAVILAEENSIGNPNIELLQQEGFPILGFNTNGATKAPLIENLSLAIEREEIEIIDEPVIRAELEAYEGEKNKTTGRMVYNAPDGQHDDTVIALALSVWARMHLYELLAHLDEIRNGQIADALDEAEYRQSISAF